ncbi:hypothetical protein CRUP_001945 [Coryphaenoides rupestris]|nr:hypothetical protein CRUP_001945 [Coryphaenoides rupestris]
MSERPRGVLRAPVAHGLHKLAQQTEECLIKCSSLCTCFSCFCEEQLDVAVPLSPVLFLLRHIISMDELASKRLLRLGKLLRSRSSLASRSRFRITFSLRLVSSSRCLSRRFMSASMLEMVILCLMTSEMRHSSNCHFPAPSGPAVRRYEDLVSLGAALPGAYMRPEGGLQGSWLGSEVMTFLMTFPDVGRAISHASGGWVTGTAPSPDLASEGYAETGTFSTRASPWPASNTSGSFFSSTSSSSSSLSNSLVHSATDSNAKAAGGGTFLSSELAALASDSCRLGFAIFLQCSNSSSSLASRSRFRITFSFSAASRELSTINRGLQSFSGFSCIRFVRRSNQRDYLSIQSLNGYAFSKNKQPTMVPIPNQNIPIGKATQMSQNDINRLNKLYKC